MMNGQSWFMVKPGERLSFNSSDVSRLVTMTLQCGMKYECGDCRGRTINLLLMRMQRWQASNIGTMKKATLFYRKRILLTSATVRFAETTMISDIIRSNLQGKLK